MGNNEFKISDLSGDWKKWAKAANNYNESKADDKINSTFEEYYIMYRAKEAGKTADEVAAIFGADFAKKYIEIGGVKEQKAPTKRNTKLMQNDVLTTLTSSKKSYIANPNWKEFANTLKKTILEDRNALLDNEYYAQLMNAVDQIAEVMNNLKYESREDIIQLYEKAKDNLDLKRKDPLKDFKLEVLEEFVFMADEHQKNIEFEKLSNKFYDLRKSGKTRTEALDLIKADKDFQGSYYQNYWGPDGRQSVEQDAAAYYNHGLINLIEKTVVLADAKEDSWTSVSEQKIENLNDDAEVKTTKKGVKQAAKENIDDFDKYVKKYFRTGGKSLVERLQLKESEFDSHMNSVAIHNDVELKKEKNYTYDELKACVKDENLLPHLIGTIITKDESFNIYNTSKIAEIIEPFVGTNNVAHLDKKQIPYSEVHNIARELSRQACVNIPVEDAIKLIEFVGFKVGKNTVAKAAYDSTVGNLMSFVAPLISSTFAYQESFRPMINMFGKDVIDLNIKSTGGTIKVNQKDLLLQLQKDGFALEDIFIENTPEGFKLYASKPYAESAISNSDITVWESISDRAGAIALKSVILVAVLNFLHEAFTKTPVEGPLAVTQFATNDLQEYYNIVDSQANLNDEQKQGLKYLAELSNKTITNENGSTTTTWDAEEFKLLLNEIGGDMSLLSSDEFAIGLFDKKEAILNMIEEKTKNIQTDKTKQTKGEEKQSQDQKSTKTEPNYSVKTIERDCITPEPNFHNAHQHTWQGIVALYPNCKHKYLEIVHAIKDINGINYSDNVIPPDLYLPDYLFDEKDENNKRNPLDNANQYVKNKDATGFQKVSEEELVSNGIKLDCIEQPDGYVVETTNTDGTKTRSETVFDTEEKAKSHIDYLKRTK